jgi:nucleoside phosphorylase
MNKTRPSASARDGRWLVVCAWRPEMAHLRARLPDLPAHVRRRVILATIGVGLVEAAIATAHLLAKHRPDAVLLVGTAGVYPGNHPGLALGNAAGVRRIRLLPPILAGRHAFLPAIVATESRASPALASALCLATGLPRGDVACPLAITASAKAAAAAAKLSGCALENLEAFAVARAAATAGVPFAAILGIANHVGPAGHREWKEHARAAAAVACQAVLEFLAK